MADNSAEQGARWLSPEQLDEWKSLMGLLMTVPASLDAQLKQDAGLNLFEYHILVELAEAPERTRVMSERTAPRTRWRPSPRAVLRVLQDREAAWRQHP
jgi:hypothetical protein